MVLFILHISLYFPGLSSKEQRKNTKQLKLAGKLWEKFTWKSLPSLASNLHVRPLIAQRCGPHRLLLLVCTSKVTSSLLCVCDSKKSVPLSTAIIYNTHIINQPVCGRRGWMYNRIVSLRKLFCIGNRKQRTQSIAKFTSMLMPTGVTSLKNVFFLVAQKSKGGRKKEKKRPSSPYTSFWPE